jgi:hypothetical protein
VLDLRLYRLTLLPFAVLFVIAAFSLHAPGATLRSNPAQTIGGARALQKATAWARLYPNATPGSPADAALATHLEPQLAPCRRAQAGCSVQILDSSVETTSGTRTVRTVIASRAGTGPAVALIASRGPGAANLIGTALLVQLAALYQNLAPGHPLTIVSTSGGASAMGAVAAMLPHGTEAAIVVGDLSGSLAGGTPYVVPWSASGALAPVQLRRTIAAALSSALSRPVGDPSFAGQLARLALPLTTGAQGTLGGAGVPAELVGLDGEGAPPSAAAGAKVAGAFGQALLVVTAALDQGPALEAAPTRDLAVGTQVLGGWAARAVIAALLLSLLACGLDVLARARRRRAPVLRWTLWTLSCALPFALTGAFAAFLGAGGLLPATPAAAVTPSLLPVSAGGAAALVSAVLVFILAWVLHAAVTARSSCAGRPEPVGGAAALILTGTAVAALVWLANPYTAALIAVPMHLWLIVLTREQPRRPALGAFYVAVSLAPFIAALGVVCVALHTEPFGLLWTMLLLIAGGGMSGWGVILASLFAGTFVAAGALLIRSGTLARAERVEVTVRGPLSYAGPGSLGGTPSALRR